EAYITGDKSDYEKFVAWSETIPNLFGNPLYHWTHLELLRYFNIDELLNKETAPSIWEEANKKLASPEMSARRLLQKKNVEFIGTTDDPTDDLKAHESLAKENINLMVSPSFRPDSALKIEDENFFSWIEKLEQVIDSKIDNYKQFIDGLTERIEYFDEHGCKSSDHGINTMFFEEVTKQEVESIFKKRLRKEKLTEKEID